MLRPVLLSLALIGCLGANAHAQSPGDPGPEAGESGDMTPSLILPHDMTSPTLSGFGPGDAAQSAPANPDQPNAYEPEPYSVEGEETLDPGGN